mmetsp:Transcript_30027/g.44393  ORF Transcript_30027/g.44393 Transcript_30027/m.44393 type:complete len:720 (+) Transcript_30027:258-2417(+)|eukprot:CAMPEP_0194202054 /NCGR_PEP_ID=MMETSP0156-20130528/2175_1 /TAXON_ID=33649 /ORGANISM="Thalassionema nitzschioides, Strain L26-B" /LENGTH=719 /DNA_ID=CAMNT_0038927423 /DNA_START=200 /DNA_END=2359 /DNA_ORIENTATION=+
MAPQDNNNNAAAAGDDNDDALANNNSKHSSGGVSSVHEPSKAVELGREPFFAFIPAVFRWAGGIVGGELGHLKNGVTSFPSFTKSYVGGAFTFYRKNPRVFYDEVISGFTVAIMQVPESIAFSFVAGVPPLSGLHATFWMALITGLLGGKPGMISGAAGALAVVVTKITAEDGALPHLTTDERLNVLYMTMFACGWFQILFAWLRLAKLVRLIPETGMIGFMNGLAIIIFMAQLPAFKTCPGVEYFVDCTLDQRQWLTFQNEPWVLTATLVQVALCMAIMKWFPKVPKIGKIIPSSLVGLLIGAFVEHVIFRIGLGVETRTVAQTAQMSGSLPMFNWPAIPAGDSTALQVVLVYGVTLAAIGGVESVLTLQACNEITDTVPKISESNQELFAQGLANLISGLFSAMGGDAMIGQSTINIMNGARYRVSSTMSGIFMLLFVVALAPFINLLPIATLTGVLFMVVISTFQWKTFVILRYGRLSDSIAILLVTIIAVFFNLAIAIGVGIVFSALVHAWDSGTHVTADISFPSNLKINGVHCHPVKYVHIRGSIFFGSAREFINQFNIATDPDTVIIDLQDALVQDHSAVAAIQGITHRFAQAGKQVLIVNLPTKSRGRLERTHGDYDMLQKQVLHKGDVERGGDSLRNIAVGYAPSTGEVNTDESNTMGDGTTVEYHTHKVDPNPHSLENLEMLHAPLTANEVELELDQLAETSKAVTIERE